MRDVLGHYHCYNPAIAIELVEGSASEHLARITERQLDVAFVTGTPTASHCDTAVLLEGPGLCGLADMARSCPRRGG